MPGEDINARDAKIDNMPYEDSGLTAGLKPVVRGGEADHCCTEKQMGSLRRDRRASRSQNIFLNFAGRSFG